MAMMMSTMVALNFTSDVEKNMAHDHAQVVHITLFVAVLCLCLLIGHLLEEIRWVNESIVAIFCCKIHTHYEI
ncbi:unnamed protein product [Lathyrus sativus]|nr:unnamed protein product [Lathyrus sativus]